MKAFTLHQAAVLPTATAHIITLDDQYEDDITTSQLLPTGGFCRVPEGAGLGVEVDEEKLKQAAQREHIPKLDVIGVIHLPDGRKYYTRGEPNVEKLTGFEEGALRGIYFERLVKDESPDFERVQNRLEEEGPFIE